jgi:hypothetical protein
VPRIQLDPKTGLPSIAGDRDQYDVPSTHRAVRPNTTAREEVLGQTAAELGVLASHSGAIRYILKRANLSPPP